MGRTVIAVNQGKDKNYRLEWGIDRIRREAPLESHLGDMGACWWDIDNDGWLDMAIGQMSYPTANLEGQERLYILRQNDSGYFDDISKKLGIFYSMKEAHSMEPYDYDMDGDHDLIFSRQVRDTIEVDTVINGKPQKIKVQNVYMKVHLLENNIGNKNNWIGMKLNPPKGSNRSGIGSRIHIWSEGLCQMRDLQAGIGHFANQQSFIHLAGIGQRNRVDSVIIRWQMPGFPESKFYDLPINTYLGIDSSSYKFLDTWTANQDLLSPNIAFESTFLDFGKVNKGESNELSFYIKFPDTVDDFPNLKVDSIKLNSAIFEIIANPAPFIITKGERKEVKVKFTPDQRANYNAKIEIFSNASNGKLRKYDLYGFGFEPKPIISLSTEILDFDTVHIDTPKVKEIIIENIGEEELTVSNISFLLNPNEVFKLDGISLPFSLSAGESKVINISFHPFEYISYVGKFRISSNGFNSQQNTINIIGWGDGPKPELAVVETLEFGEIEIGKTIEKNLTLENSGGGVLEIKDLKIYINNDSAYQILDFKPPYTLVQNQKVDIKVAFSPKRAGTLSRPVDIYSSSYYGETKRMTFYGVGLEPSGTMEENTEKGTIYPNPAKDIVYVSFDSDKLLGDFKLQLFDESACEVSNFKYSRLCDCNNTYIINTSFLQTGSYRIFIKDSGLFFNEPIMILK